MHGLGGGVGSNISSVCLFTRSNLMSTHHHGDCRKSAEHCSPLLCPGSPTSFLYHPVKICPLCPAHKNTHMRQNASPPAISPFDDSPHPLHHHPAEPPPPAVADPALDPLARGGLRPCARVARRPRARDRPQRRRRALAVGALLAAALGRQAPGRAGHFVSQRGRLGRRMGAQD